MFNPIHKHWVVAKDVLRYIHDTVAYGLRYASSGGALLLGYTDSDWGGNIVDHKSTLGYYYNLGSAMISWSNKN